MKFTKAQIQIQFNWLFVIIIGSVFLMFFFGIINTESKTNEERISISQSKFFETIISATAQKDGTYKEYPVDGLEIEYECKTLENEHSYFVQGFHARETKYDLLFTRKKLDADDIQTWTQQWEVPFKAGTFLYVTNSKQGFIFYNLSGSLGRNEPSTRFKLLYESFPKNLSVDVVDDVDFEFEDVQRRNYESNTFVFLAGEEPQLSENYFSTNINNPRIIVIKPESGNTFFDYGRMFFLDARTYVNLLNDLDDFEDLAQSQDLDDNERRDGLEEVYGDYDEYSSYYLGKASMYGSLFSQDKQIYDCNMQKAFNRLQLVTHMYFIRTASFIDSGIISERCEDTLGGNDYSPEEANIGLFLRPRNRLWALQEYYLAEGTPEEMEIVYEYLFGLEENNKQLSTITRCPTIY